MLKGKGRPGLHRPGPRSALVGGAAVHLQDAGYTCQLWAILAVPRASANTWATADCAEAAQGRSSVAWAQNRLDRSVLGRNPGLPTPPRDLTPPHLQQPAHHSVSPCDPGYVRALFETLATIRVFSSAVHRSLR
jgi:hypothetical protein